MGKRLGVNIPVFQAREIYKPPQPSPLWLVQGHLQAPQSTKINVCALLPPAGHVSGWTHFCMGSKKMPFALSISFQFSLLQPLTVPSTLKTLLGDNPI